LSGCVAIECGTDFAWRSLLLHTVHYGRTTRCVPDALVMPTATELLAPRSVDAGHPGCLVCLGREGPLRGARKCLAPPLEPPMAARVLPNPPPVPTVGTAWSTWWFSKVKLGAGAQKAGVTFDSEARDFSKSETRCWCLVVHESHHLVSLS
jgi:hypothetical protein